MSAGLFQRIQTITKPIVMPDYLNIEATKYAELAYYDFFWYISGMFLGIRWFDGRHPVVYIYPENVYKIADETTEAGQMWSLLQSNFKSWWKWNLQGRIDDIPANLVLKLLKKFVWLLKKP